MLGLLAPLLGGLGGLLFPAAGAAATGAAATGIGGLLAKAALPALGAGLGTVLTGGSGKDAIRNALLFGAGSAMFPGIGEKIRGSEFGKGITGGLGELFGLGQEAPGPVPAAPASGPASSRPQPRPSAIPQMAMPDGQGMTGMEADARGRTTLPSISDVNMVRPEGLRPPYNMARPEGFEIPYLLPEIDMVRPEADIEFSPGMTMRDDARSEAMRRYFETAVDTPEARRRARDAVIFSRRPPPGFGEMLTYDPTLGYAQGGAIEGPGTGTSDSIPATIYQDGKPVRKAALSDGEFVMTAAAVKGAGNGSRERGISRMYELMRRFESGEMS